MDMVCPEKPWLWARGMGERTAGIPFYVMGSSGSVRCHVNHQHQHHQSDVLVCPLQYFKSLELIGANATAPKVLYASAQTATRLHSSLILVIITSSSSS
jgi:hypothetical protein